MAKSSPLWSPRKTRWMLNLFPPLLLQRVKVRSVETDFSDCTVVIRRSLLTRNLHGSTFGGTLFSGADPIYPVLLWQALLRRDLDVEAWLESATIEYAAPARSDITMHFPLEPGVLDEAETALRTHRRFRYAFSTVGRDAQGAACVRIESKVHLKSRSVIR